MHEYEIFIEEINPCGGEQYSKKTLIEAEAVSPEAYVKENGRFPVLVTFLIHFRLNTRKTHTTDL